MKKKLFFGLLIISAMLMLIPLTSSAKTYGGEFNSTTKDPNGNAYICQWIFDEGSKTLYVEGVGQLAEYSAGNFPWEKYREKAEHVVVEEGVTGIGKRGFASHTYVKDYELPSTLAYIAMRAFEYNYSLEEITIPGSVGIIQDQAFLECKKLKKVVFEEGVGKIGCYIFGNSAALEEVYVYGKNTQISRMRSNNDDGVWFRGMKDFSKLTVYCYEGTNADKYFTQDIYTITNWVNDWDGKEVTQSFAKKENSMTAGGYTLNVEYLQD